MKNEYESNQVRKKQAKFVTLLADGMLIERANLGISQLPINQ